MDLDTVTTTGALAAIRGREIGSEELLDAQLLRVSARNPALNLLVALDEERARARCREADAALARGEWWGPLHGLPMTVKDSFETEGLLTTCGAPELASHRPERDADVVALLKAAGAIVFGKTNTPLYAGDFQTYNAVHGLSRNPWDPERTTGGSSGGAAGAVAAGMTLLEVGSDIGGSIRGPAHYNGVFGHKVTWGAISARGHIPGPPGSLAPADLGVMGPIGRSADDLDLALDVLTGPDLAGVPGGRLPEASPATRSLQGLRVGLWVDDPAVPTSRSVADALRRLADDLSDAGATIDETVRPAWSLEQLTELYVYLLSAVMTAGLPDKARATLREVLESEAGEVDPIVVAQARGALGGHADWLRADERRYQVMAQWDRVFERVDVMLTPCSPVPAFPHDVDRPFPARTVDVDGWPLLYFRLVVWPGVATLPMLPATAVPIDRSPEGLPIGAQVIGPRWGDRTTLAVARLLEGTGRGFRPPPSGTGPERPRTAGGAT